VEAQQVIPIEARSADGRLVVEAGMWAVPVVGVEPLGKQGGSLLRAVVGTSIGPFSESCLDEAFCLSVGSRGVGPGAAVSDAGGAAGVGELARTVAGAVIGEHGFEADAEPGIPGKGSLESCDGRTCLLVGLNGGCCDARVIVDSDVDVLEAAAPRSVALAAGGAEGTAGEASELLDVQMEHVARSCVLVAWIDRHRLEIAHAVELEPTQDAADRGPAQTGMGRDPVAGPALPAQRCHGGHLRLRGRATQPVGARSAVAQGRTPSLPIPPDPLGRGLRRDAEAGRGQLQRHPLLQNSSGQQLSTPDRQSGILVIVHSVSFSKLLVRTISFYDPVRMDNLLRLHT